jgi:hypothetical protein
MWHVYYLLIFRLCNKTDTILYSTFYTFKRDMINANGDLLELQNKLVLQKQL